MRDELGDAELARMAVFAERLADVARQETLPRWTSACAAEDKNEGGEFDPVTAADRGAEQAMRAVIEATFPEHGISGEEFADRPTAGPYSWSLDPVDGTRSFICRLPTWVTLIALLQDGIPVLGVIDAPSLNERYVGFSRGFSRIEGQQSSLATSGCKHLREARLSTTDPYLMDLEAKDGWERVRRQARTTRYGHDGYAYARLAAGSIDLVVEAGLKPHDYNALIPVVRSGGGVIGDWQGGEDLSSGAVIAAASPELFEAAVEAMR